jgi:beta-glucosidase
MFAKYANKAAEELGDLTDAFITINEPQVYVLQSYTLGIWPPNKINPILSLLVQLRMAKGHRSAYKSIKSIDPDYKVGIVKNIVWYENHKHRFHPFDRLWRRFLYWLNGDFFLRMLRGENDFIGFNYYFTNRVKHLRLRNPNDWESDLGWWINPKGLYNILLDLKKYNVPIYITENGLADSKDKHRKKFIKEMLVECAKAIEKGAPLKGYFHWSLLDNYEWHHGFWPRFGLVEIDREDGLKRKSRESFYYYAKVCKEKRLNT